jgi:hypothetical protein
LSVKTGGKHSSHWAVKNQTDKISERKFIFLEVSFSRRGAYLSSSMEEPVKVIFASRKTLTYVYVPAKEKLFAGRAVKLLLNYGKKIYL